MQKRDQSYTDKSTSAQQSNTGTQNSHHLPSVKLPNKLQESSPDFLVTSAAQQALQALDNQAHHQQHQLHTDLDEPRRSQDSSSYQIGYNRAGGHSESTSHPRQPRGAAARNPLHSGPQINKSYQGELSKLLKQAHSIS